MRAFTKRDIAELGTAEGKLSLLEAIDRTSKFTVARLFEKASRNTHGSSQTFFSRPCPTAF